MLKIYAVSGLIDWQTSLPVGKARLNIHFTGGAMTKYGVTPAEFSTSDPITQRVIEDSAHFREGRIYLLKAIGGEEKSSLPANPAKPRVQVQTMDVACVEDAAAYLNEKHALPTKNLRTLESVNAAAVQYGLRFTIKP